MAGLSWRWVYVVGAFPALLVFWIRRSIREPEKWQQAKEKASLGKELGAIGDIFLDPKLRRNTVAALMMAVAGQGALWGIGFFSVDLLLTVLDKFSLPVADIDRTKSIMFLVQNMGPWWVFIFSLYSVKELTGALLFSSGLA